jgi:tRNA dimethylallyltransferase
MTTPQKSKILIIVGPTGSGKTSLSVTLAKAYNGEIISADSRQVYRGLDIATEKITKEQMDGIPHHLIDIIDPTDVYSVNNFVADARAAIHDIAGRGKLPIIAGGTFFYIDTLLGKNIAPAVPPNPELRAQLEQQTHAYLYEHLRTLDPRRAEEIDPANKRRLVRALEIAESLGYVPQAQTQVCPYEVLTIGLRIDKAVHRAKLGERAAQALERGLIEEIDTLLKQGVSKERLAEIGLEYRETLAYLDGTITKERLLERFTEVNWQYAKRQLTWLKRDSTITWFTPTDLTDIYKSVEDFLEKN